MFESFGRSVVFIETAFHFQKQRHTYIDCIPLPSELAQDVSLYFKVRVFMD
jgi:hypothetical protein